MAYTMRKYRIVCIAIHRQVICISASYPVKRSVVMRIITRAATLLFLCYGFSGTLPCRADDRQLIHAVYFELEKDTQESRESLVAACRKHLTDHEGTVHFSVSEIAGDLTREVNDTAFDVALTIVFADRKAHDLYQTHPRHLRFIEENKETWSNVRVFDSYVTVPTRNVDRLLSTKIAFSVKDVSLHDAVKALMKVAMAGPDTEEIQVTINSKSLQMEGITVNQRIRSIKKAEKSVRDLLTDIVVAANPNRSATGPSDLRQTLVWVTADDGKSILITTRRAAMAAKMELPKAFQAETK